MAKAKKKNKITIQCVHWTSFDHHQRFIFDLELLNSKLLSFNTRSNLILAFFTKIASNTNRTVMNGLECAWIGPT